MIRYLWCLIRFHHPRRNYWWDMVGNPRYDGWYDYNCSKCGHWRDE